MVDTNGLRCYIHTEKDCCETGDNPSLKVLMNQYSLAHLLVVPVRSNRYNVMQFVPQNAILLMSGPNFNSGRSASRRC